MTNIYDQLNQQPHLQALIQDFYYESLGLRQQATEAFKLNNSNFKLLMWWNKYEANWGQEEDDMPLHQVARGIFGMREYFTLPFSITQVCDAMPRPLTEVDPIRKIHKLGL